MAARISSSVFPMLGAEPMLGRTFTIGEDAPAQNVVILSYGLWQRRFGADQALSDGTSSSIGNHTPSLA